MKYDNFFKYIIIVGLLLFLIPQITYHNQIENHVRFLEMGYEIEELNEDMIRVGNLIKDSLDETEKTVFGSLPEQL